MTFLGKSWIVLIALFGLCMQALAQSTPNVPQQYKRLFYQYSDQRTVYEKALNSIGKTGLPVGRSFAIIAGVTQYPNLSIGDRELKPASIDLEKLKSYLKDQEYFDEIIVLKDGNFNLDTLNYFLDSYLPDRLSSFPHSRFLFAYTGHGYAMGSGDTARGFLLTSPAISKTDPVNRLDLNLLRTLLDPVVDSTEKVLVLINSCQSGAFLGRKSFGANPLGPGDRGAHAIMASRSSQLSLSLATVGPGSVFFEKIFAGLGGAADIAPRDGVVTYHELDTYLRAEIPLVTNNNQIPMEGDISRNGSVGEFFFLNRERQVQIGNSKPWNPGTATSFGAADSSNVYDLGKTAYEAERYEEAFQYFDQAATAGNSNAEKMLGWFYENGLVVTADLPTARQWYEKAAAGGNASAMSDLGRLFAEGLVGNTRDYQQARQWWEKAAAAGDADAMLWLGELYEYQEGVALDCQKARYWYEKAASTGGVWIIERVASYYQFHEGVLDYQKARQWYEKAAAVGDTAAMNNLGVLYENGQGGPTDYPQAKRYYEKAAAKGLARSMYHLGVLYELGNGVEPDSTQAQQWFKKAAAEGEKDAVERLQKLKEQPQ